MSAIVRNPAYASSFDKGHLALPPAKKYLVLTCMDARIDPAAAFGIGLGDAHVIGNAGASAQDALRSIVISEQLLGTTRSYSSSIQEALLTSRSDAFQELKSRALDFFPFPHLKTAVEDDVKSLKSSPLIPDAVPTSGWVYKVETGKVERVV
ncbi:hypothetical protein IAR55_000712 [Kwoniella newhampshirensis]|uniref:Carbonic anhydrase n=1 Tax=Kwoniella newhampshirensis TaxID=1651941 RepID=A0AAW0Z3V5_9TREE